MSLLEIKLTKFSISYLIIICSISIFIFVYYVNFYSSSLSGDEYSYIGIAKLFKTGVFSIGGDTLHTYLYPLIIMLFLDISAGDIVTAKVLISIFQYLIYLGTVIFLANTITKNLIQDRKRIVWFSMVSFGFLNPYLICFSTVFLTDLLSSCLLITSLIILTTRNLNTSKNIAMLFGFYYLSIMVRPLIIVFLPVIISVLIFMILKKKNVSTRKIIIFGMCLLVILLPQLYLNVVGPYHKWTPLTTGPGWALEMRESPYYLKINTMLVGEGTLWYYTPFDLPGYGPKDFNVALINIHDGNDFLSMIKVKPLEMSFVYVAHIFGLIDWGYVEPYVPAEYPASRLPGSLLLYSFWFLVIMGTIHFFKTKDKSFRTKLMLFVMSSSTLLYALFMGTVMAEGRYGFPFWFLSLPFLALGINAISNIISPAKYLALEGKSNLLITKTKFIISYLCFIMIFFYLSFLLDLQTHRIDWFHHILNYLK